MSEAVAVKRQSVDLAVSIEGAEDSAQAFRANRADVIQRLFPHLSSLEKYALSTVLEHDLIHTLSEKGCSEQFARGVRQYIEYMSGRDKWEERNLDEKARPVWFRERQPK